MFIGIPLDGAVVQGLRDELVPLKAQVDKTLATASTPAPTIRWVKPENWHITLAFLGQISGDKARHIGKLLAQALAATKPVPAELQVICGFPHANSPIIAALLADNAALQKLYEQIQAICEIAGLPREQRPFTPHITLARLKNPGGQGRKRHRRARLADEFSIPSVPVNKPLILNRVQLLKSQLSPEGSHYESHTELLLRP